MRRTIERALGEVSVAMTERRAHGIDLAREAADEGRELVVAVGGDGTFNEVVNGVLQAKRKGARVAMIAQGTGGDFRRTLGLEHRLDRYLDAISRGNARDVDVGLLRYRERSGALAERYFVNILSAGMGGLVDRYVAETGPALGRHVPGFAGAWSNLGTTKYALASIRAIAACARGRLRCTVTSGGGREQKKIRSYMIAICNGRFFGSGMHVAPMAKIDDGRFEVINMDARSKLALVMTARKIYAGEHLREPGVSHFACERLAIDLENASASDRFLLDVDGEPMGGLPIDVELVPRAVALVC
jgi:YegS/Rv2252/BmrU family lipid kinase